MIWQITKKFSKRKLVVTEKISGGQKQRISSRTLFKNPEIIILDEPASVLNKENHQKL